MSRALSKRERESWDSLITSEGAALGLSAPWTLAAAAAAALGVDCRVRLVKVSGETVELLSREKGRRAAEFTRDLAAGLADRLNGK